MNTLRKGSRGLDVVAWQKIVGVTADGVFGAQTEQATKEWQKKNKLVPDGIVGKMSWATAQGKPVTKGVKSENSPTDEWARATVREAIPDATEHERQYLQTVARGEGYYGKGWGTDPYKGAGSKNWGAVTGTGSAGSFMHTDYLYDANGKYVKPYVTNFKKYATDTEAVRDMAKILLKQNVRDFLNKGKLKEAVEAQRKNGYYTLPAEQYFDAVTKNYVTLTANLGWPKLLAGGKWWRKVWNWYWGL